jgi:hypothetical protein
MIIRRSVCEIGVDPTRDPKVTISNYGALTHPRTGACFPSVDAATSLRLSRCAK